MVLCLFLFFLIGFLSGSLPRTLIQAEPLKGINITRAERGKYPYVVSIARRNDQLIEEKQHLCTGVLITNKFVLTAAHCFEKRLLGEIRLIVGSVDLRDGVKFDPSMWITYNQWADSKNITKKYDINDIALIKLSEKVSSKIAKPAALSSKTINELIDEYIILFGWGRTNENPNDAARYLQEVKFKVLSNDVCENIMYNLLKRKIFIPPIYLCTKGEPYALLGPGDSGGPVLRRNSVVAISRSICPRKDVCNLPEAIVDERTINARIGIDAYREFIADVLNSY